MRKWLMRNGKTQCRIAEESPNPLDGMSTSPRVILTPNKLRLTRAQEDRLMDHVKKRFDDIREEMGWLSDNEYDEGSFLEKRRQAWAEYYNDFEHRRNVAKYGPLYRSYNDCSFNIPKRAARVYSARAREALLNSEPFAGLLPEGEEDQRKIVKLPGVELPPDPIKLADRLWNHKLKKAKANIHLRDGVEGSAVGGEVVNKITLKLDDCEDEEKEAQIWLDGSSEPLRDARGMFVFAEEKFEAHPDLLEGEILSRDPTVVKLPDAALSEEKYPVERLTQKKDLDIQGIDYRNFICSPTAPDIHSTDYIAHTFDFDLDKLWEMTAGRTLGPEARSWREGLKSQSTAAKADSNRPNENAGEKERGASAPVVLQLAESWLRFDARERGKTDEICVLWDVTTNYPLHYDLNTEVTPTRTKRRPFEVDRVIPEKGRWSGVGFYSLLSNEHQYTDRQLARLETRTSTSGRFTYMREGTIKDVEGGWDIDLNSPKIYTATSLLKPNEKPLEHVELPPMDERIWELLNMRLQQAQLMSGTMTPGDMNSVDLNPSKTLGGQEMLASESELMSNDTMQDVRHGIEQALQQTLLAVFANYDPEEAAELLGAENAAVLTKWLATHKPKDLMQHVKLLMSKSKSRMQLEANTQALKVVTGERSWLDLQQMVAMGQLSPEFLDNVRHLYQGILEANEVENPDGILKFTPPPAPALPAPGAPMTPNPNEQPAFPPSSLPAA